MDVGAVRHRTGVARLAAILLLLGGATFLATSCLGNSEAAESAALVNSERGRAGLGLLAQDETLNAKAEAWAAKMAAAGRASHSDLSQGSGSNWTRIAENVGKAGSVAEMHGLFMQSPKHRDAILNSGYTRFGTGVAVADGQYYVVQVFVK
jgi:uncharacterized protein YkwD